MGLLIARYKGRRNISPERVGIALFKSIVLSAEWALLGSIFVRRKPLVGLVDISFSNIGTLMGRRALRRSGRVLDMLHVM